jgi:hypothetical protein
MVYDLLPVLLWSGLLQCWSGRLSILQRSRQSCNQNMKLARHLAAKTG